MSDDREPIDDLIPDEITVPIENFIDLHTFRPREVSSVVESYLEAALEEGFAMVRIIHGKGIGVQKEMVRSVLEKHPAVLEFTTAPPERGGWGATLVRLKKAGGEADPGK